MTISATEKIYTYMINYLILTLFFIIHIPNCNYQKFQNCSPSMQMYLMSRSKTHQHYYNILHVNATIVVDFFTLQYSTLIHNKFNLIKR